MFPLTKQKMQNLSWYLYIIPVFLALHLFTKHFLHKIQNIPPTPFPSLPIIGHLYLIKQPLHRTLSILSKRHGPIFFLQLGSRKVIVITSPSLAEECLTKNDVVFANRPLLAVGKYIGQNNNSLAWAPYGDHWRNLRRIASLGLFSNQRLQLLSGIREYEAKAVIRKLLNHDRSQDVDMRALFYELTMNVMTKVIAGKRFCGENISIADAEEGKIFRAINEEAIRLAGKGNIVDFFPWIKLRVLVRELIESRRKRDELIQSLIEEKGKTMVNGNEKTMIEVLLTSQETDPEYYTDDIIIGLMLVTSILLI